MGVFHGVKFEGDEMQRCRDSDDSMSKLHFLRGCFEFLEGLGVDEHEVESHTIFCSGKELGKC